MVTGASDGVDLPAEVPLQSKRATTRTGAVERRKYLLKRVTQRAVQLERCIGEAHVGDIETGS